MKPMAVGMKIQERVLIVGESLLWIPSYPGDISSSGLLDKQRYD